MPRVGLTWAARPVEADVATGLAIVQASIDQVVAARTALATA
ncbi:hypothetical protein ACFUMH_18000 [Cellulomonas sp. NPDC057328]